MPRLRHDAFLVAFIPICVLVQGEAEKLKEKLALAEKAVRYETQMKVGIFPGMNSNHRGCHSLYFTDVFV